MAQPDIDVSQSEDPSVPVVIAGIRSYTGKGNWRKQLMIEGVVLKNRLPKRVTAIRFGWIIITEQANKEKQNREAALLQGYSEILDPELSASSFKRLKSLNVDFIKKAKPLIRNGNLDGRFFLRIRVCEVRFEDGSLWKESAIPLYPRKYAHAPSRLQQVSCPNERCLFYENGQGYCEVFDASFGWLCRRGAPCNPADPEACTCDSFLCSQCEDRDNDAWYDCEGDCDDTPNSLQAFETHPGAEEICDGIDNDCNGQIDDNCTVPTPTPTPTATPSPIGGLCSWGEVYNADAGRCCPDPPPIVDCGYVVPETGCPYEHQVGCGITPIVIDVAGDGLQMTDAINGVYFDFDGNSDHILERLSWTTAGSDDVFLVLDRNGNGLIDSGRELFGNYTPQPASPNRNGFLALATFDTPEKGGNGDTVLSNQDAVFTSLRLWQDVNHNGISEASELLTLASRNIQSVSVDYKESMRRDPFGNQFRYRAKITDHLGGTVGRWAWDVFLLKGL